ncbi:MAG: hypothetical protein JST75_21550 [Bacteroidetes bacterium]|nr:hypothetical protein [Bacteroidota bacterium]
MKKQLCLTGILLSLAAICIAQQADSVIDKISQFPNRLFAKIKTKTDRLDEQLTRQTEKYLERLAKKEKKLQQKLYAKDSVAAKNLFAGSQEKYQQLEQKLKTIQSGENKALSGEYLPYVDSLKGSLSFLEKNKNLLNGSPDLKNKIGSSLGSFNQLQTKLQTTEEIKDFIRQRKQLLKETINRYENSLGLNKYMEEYNQQAYYYSQQVREYKEILNDPDKLAQKALVVLNKLPAFQDFMKNNSQLAGLFNIPGDYGSASAIDGLQTRDQVMQILQGQIGSGGSNGMAALQSNLESAHQQLDQFKDKLSALGNGSGDIDMPKFKPNDQKTKPFLKRLELGTNLQTTRTNYFFPTTTDIGLSLGYKLGNKGTAGIGASYKIGWGTGINHISISSQGVGLRSFLDMKLKKNFYISGGYEENYQQPFNSFQDIRELHSWQHSGLIGLSKMVSLKSKMIKKTKVQLLWDFLSYYQLPRTQPIKFRVGYNF